MNATLEKVTLTDENLINQCILNILNTYSNDFIFPCINDIKTILNTKKYCILEHISDINKVAIINLNLEDEVISFLYTEDIDYIHNLLDVGYKKNISDQIKLIQDYNKIYESISKQPQDKKEKYNQLFVFLQFSFSNNIDKILPIVFFNGFKYTEHKTYRLSWMNQFLSNEKISKDKDHPKIHYLFEKIQKSINNILVECYHRNTFKNTKALQKIISNLSIAMKNNNYFKFNDNELYDNKIITCIRSFLSNNNFDIEINLNDPSTIDSDEKINVITSLFNMYNL